MRGRDSSAMKYQNWKDAVPVIYDWITHHHLMWPSLSCRWGKNVEDNTFKHKQQIYYSEQTDGSAPNTLVVALAQVVRPRVAAAEHIGVIDEERRSPYITTVKTIIHPGEVNRIRELPRDNHIVATHSDVPEVYIWNLDTQPGQMGHLDEAAAEPDLVLTGHTGNAPFALAMSPLGPFVLSGGEDNNVVLWSLEDHMSSLVSSTTGAANGSANGKGQRTVECRAVFSGHSATVEDVCFSPASVHELCSVGDDHALLFWDSRMPAAPCLQVKNAHEDDVQCVDWNPHDSNLVLTGSADKTVNIFDRRKFSLSVEPLYTFNGHKDSVTCVQWHPENPTVFGTSADDGLVLCWDYSKVGKESFKGDLALEGGEVRPELFFRHMGHRAKVVDFQWNPIDPWAVISASDDLNEGGGNIQIWRMNQLLCMDEEEAIAELSKFHSRVTGGVATVNKSKSAGDGGKGGKGRAEAAKRKPAPAEEAKTEQVAKKDTPKKAKKAPSSGNGKESGIAGEGEKKEEEELRGEEGDKDLEKADDEGEPAEAQKDDGAHEGPEEAEAGEKEMEGAAKITPAAAAAGDGGEVTGVATAAVGAAEADALKGVEEASAGPEVGEGGAGEKVGPEPDVGAEKGGRKAEAQPDTEATGSGNSDAVEAKDLAEKRGEAEKEMNGDGPAVGDEVEEAEEPVAMAVDGDVDVDIEGKGVEGEEDEMKVDVPAEAAGGDVVTA